MVQRTDKGCGGAGTSQAADVERLLVNLFSPIVYFTPDERFFPVDLESTMKASALWRLDSSASPPTAAVDAPAHSFDSTAELPVKTADHFSTVVGVCGVLPPAGSTPAGNVIAPCLDTVANAYSHGTVPAELTVYATVCDARTVPNAELFAGAVLAEKGVGRALQEGLIVCYYLYFPAMESLEIESEGDWSGIALLVPDRPTQASDLTDPARIPHFEPVLAAYFHKTIDGSPPAPHFVAANGGFRRWKDVTRGVEQSVNLATHPAVYVSKGRHNCLFAPGSSQLPLSPPWRGSFEPDKIETGAYFPGPASNTLTGGGIEDTPWWVYALFPPFALMVMCATGCDYPVHFDTSGIPPGYQDGENTASDAGYQGLPGATPSPYPSQPAVAGTSSQRRLDLRLRYVDTTDPATGAIWGFAGAWGAVTLHHYPVTPGYPTNYWGYYRGARRPALAAWFLWNLFVDSAYGCRGNPSLTPVP